jgi:hypothetical protein
MNKRKMLQRQTFMPVAVNEPGKGLHSLPSSYGRTPAFTGVFNLHTLLTGGVSRKTFLT